MYGKITNNISFQTTCQISTKLERNDPWVICFNNSEKNWIPWRTLVAMATDWNNLEKFIKNQPFVWFQNNFTEMVIGWPAY